MIRFFTSILLFIFFINFSYADSAPNVIVSIKPLHAWVSAVMQGVGKPYLLLKQSDSVHSYQLKPSDAKTLSQADIIFITDKEMETYLQRSIENIAHKSEIVELSKSPGVVLLKNRVGGLFDASNHHSVISYNFHFWLDPKNAIAATKYIAEKLSQVDPKHSETYKKNAATYIQKLNQLIISTENELKNHRNINFIVFHDAYYYYENRFGIYALGSVTINPEHPAGAKRIVAIRNKIKNLEAACIYTEPQFSPSIVYSLIEGTKVKQGTLDPIGANLVPGSESYISIIKNITASLKKCEINQK